jgi:ADP-ribosyl-[dinitrogen reductase] hydrolase
MPGERDRAIGALVGLAVGDALGATLEFQARDSYPPLTDMVGGGPFQLAPGEWTDDTSMALCLTDSLISSDGFDKRDLLERFRRWWRGGENSHNGRCFDIGITTRNALLKFERDGSVDAGSDDPDSAGNGSLMRLSPVAIRWWNDPATATSVAVRQSETTHRSPMVLQCCQVFAEILCDAISTGDRDYVLRDRPWSGSHALRDVLAGKWKTLSRSEIGSSGYVFDSLRAALWCVGNADDFRHAVLIAANLGDDADTTAAITGQLAGALWGAEGIPSAWQTRLAWAVSIRERAARLFDR